jgi:hypothetical protein
LSAMSITSRSFQRGSHGELVLENDSESVAFEYQVIKEFE